jgi:spore maturation protein CgeB
VKLVVFGLSITSSWGNGHATTYRALLKAFAARGHEVDFYEWDAPYYRRHRDLPDPGFCRVTLYDRWVAVRADALATAREADAVLVGSYVDGGSALVDDLASSGTERLFFLDIDTPVTVAHVRRGTCSYLRSDQVPLFRRYLSFTAGPLLSEVLEGELGAREACALPCCVDAESHRPGAPEARFSAHMSYLGTYAEDRQEGLERLLLGPARLRPAWSFLVAGAQYPGGVLWPPSVRCREHVAPHDHSSFYSSAAWQLNLTRSDMRRAGWSPSVRLFEAAACGAAIMSDWWPGLESFFEPGAEILLPESTSEVVDVIESTHPDDRRAMGVAARRRVMNGHTSRHRARELEVLLGERRPASRPEMVGGPAD